MSFILPGGLGQIKASAPHVYSTFDPAHTSSFVTLDSGNARGTSNTTNWGTSRGQVAKSSGQLYFEVTLGGFDSTSYTAAFGMCNASFAIANGAGYVGNDVAGNSVGLWTYASSTGGSTAMYSAQAAYATLGPTFTVSNGSIIGAAVDLTNGGLYISINNTWVGGVPGGAPTFSWTPPIAWYPCISVQSSAAGTMSGALNTGPASFFSYLPAGYSAWG